MISDGCCTNVVEHAASLLEVDFGRLRVAGEARATATGRGLRDGRAAALEVECEEGGGAEPEKPMARQSYSLILGQVPTLEGR